MTTETALGLNCDATLSAKRDTSWPEKNLAVHTTPSSNALYILSKSGFE